MTKTPREQRKPPRKDPNDSYPTRSEWITMVLIAVVVIFAIAVGRIYG